MVRACLAFAALLWATAAQAQVELTLKYPENSQFTTLTEAKSEQTMTIAGMELATSSSNVTTVAQRIGARAEDGTLRIESNIESMQMQLNAPGGIQLTFHSDNPDAKSPIAELEPYLDVMRATVKTPWTIVLDEDGNITAIEGKEKMLDSLGADAAKEMQRQLDQEYLLDEANRGLEAIPVDPVKQGDTWELDSEMRLEAGQTMNFHKRYEYAGTVEQEGRTLDKITVTTTTVTYSMDPNSASPLKVTNSNLAIGSSEGHILFDRELGQALESYEKVQITGDMTFNINGMDLPGKLDLTMENTVKRQE